MKKFYISIVLGCLMSLFTLPTAGATTFNFAENLVVTEKINGDAYLLAGNGTIDADVSGDLYIAGGKVTINANVGQDLVVAGGQVTVMGDVLGDIRLFGGQLAVYGKVGEDIIFAGGTADLGKTAVVNGSIIATASILTIDGQVKDDVRGALGILLLNGTVGKNVVVTVSDTITLTANAKIIGNLEYSSLLETNIPDGVVNGTVQFNQFEKYGLLEKFNYMFFVAKLWSFISSLVLVLIFVLFAQRAMMSAAEMTKRNVLKTFGIGLLTIIASIVGGLLLIITIIGIPLTLIIFAGLLVLFYMSQVFVAAWLGSYFFDYKKSGKVKFFGMMVLAMLAYNLISIIPYVGWAFNLIFFLLGVGSIVMMKMEIMKVLKAKKML